jgi:hypothetical protein
MTKDPMYWAPLLLLLLIFIGALVAQLRGCGQKGKGGSFWPSFEFEGGIRVLG